MRGSLSSTAFEREGQDPAQVYVRLCVIASEDSERETQLTISTRMHHMLVGHTVGCTAHGFGRWQSWAERPTEGWEEDRLLSEIEQCAATVNVTSGEPNGSVR